MLDQTTLNNANKRPVGNVWLGRRYDGWEAWLVAAYGTGALFEWRDLRNTREPAPRFSAFGEIEDLTSTVQLVAP